MSEQYLMLLQVGDYFGETSVMRVPQVRPHAALRRRELSRTCLYSTPVPEGVVPTCLDAPVSMHTS